MCSKQAGEVVPALRPVEAAAGDAVPPRSEGGDVDAGHGRKPCGTRRRHHQALALGRNEQAALFQRYRNRHTEFTRQVIVVTPRLLEGAPCP